MGLDMYVWKTQKKYGVSPIKIDYVAMEQDGVEGEEFHYWRKNRHIHNWFEKLYRSKGGTGEFNCKEVKITIDDLNHLEQDIKSGEIINFDNGGFFFGENDYDMYRKEDDLKFIEQAKKELENENVVLYYGSWW